MALVYSGYVKSNAVAFINKVISIGNTLQFDPNFLMIVMYAESRIKPDAYNPNGGASGLIQFMPSTAQWLGTTTAALRAMSNVDQLDYVLKYFKSLGAAGRVKSVYDLYLLTFFPIALGKPDSWILESKDLSAYTIAVNNKIIDLNSDKKITVGEFKQYVDKYLKKKASL